MAGGIKQVSMHEEWGVRPLSGAFYTYASDFLPNFAQQQEDPLEKARNGARDPQNAKPGLQACTGCLRFDCKCKERDEPDPEDEEEEPLMEQEEVETLEAEPVELTPAQQVEAYARQGELYKAFDIIDNITDLSLRAELAGAFSGWLQIHASHEQTIINGLNDLSSITSTAEASADVTVSGYVAAFAAGPSALGSSSGPAGGAASGPA